MSTEDKDLVIDLDDEDDQDRNYWPLPNCISQYRTCCVPGCNRTKNQIFLKFPRQGEMKVEVFGPGNTTSVTIDLQELWANRVGLRVPTANAFICTKHFADTDYEIDNTCTPPVKRLTKTAVPSLNLQKAVPQCVIIPCGEDVPPSDAVLADLRKQYPGEKCCCVPFCYSSADDPEITLFTLPDHETLAKQWLINCERIDMLSKGLGAARALFLICSLHFEERVMVKRVNNRAILLHAAVPKLRLPGAPSYLPKSCTSIESYTLNGENYVKCALNTCSVYFGNFTKNVASFPKNKNILKYWLQNLKGKLIPGKDTTNSKICSSHMKELNLPHDLPSETDAIEITAADKIAPQLNQLGNKSGGLSAQNKSGSESRKKRKKSFGSKDTSDASDSDSSDADWTVRTAGRKYKKGRLRRQKKKLSPKIPENDNKSEEVDDEMLFLPEVDTILVEGEDLITPDESVKTEDVKEHSDDDCLIVDTKFETIIVDDDDDKTNFDDQNLSDDASELVISSTRSLANTELIENIDKNDLESNQVPNLTLNEENFTVNEMNENSVDNLLESESTETEDETQHEIYDDESELYKDKIYFDNLRNTVMGLKPEHRAEIRKIITDTLENFDALLRGPLQPVESFPGEGFQRRR